MQILEVRFRIRGIPGLTEHCKVGSVLSLDCDESKWDAHYQKKKKKKNYDSTQPSDVL